MPWIWLRSFGRPRSREGFRLIVHVMEDLAAEFRDQPRFRTGNEGGQLRPCTSCHKLFSEPRLHDGLCPECLRHGQRQRPNVATQQCKGCGIRFSLNLLQDGVCRSCSGEGQPRDHPETGSADHFSTSALTPELRRAYERLGCDETSSDELIKKRRRALVKACHADHLPRGLSQSSIEAANECFREVQQSYEMVMKSRRKQ